MARFLGPQVRFRVERQRSPPNYDRGSAFQRVQPCQSGLFPPGRAGRGYRATLSRHTEGTEFPRNSRDRRSHSLTKDAERLSNDFDGTNTARPSTVRYSTDWAPRLASAAITPWIDSLGFITPWDMDALATRTVITVLGIGAALIALSGVEIVAIDNLGMGVMSALFAGILAIFRSKTRRAAGRGSSSAARSSWSGTSCSASQHSSAKNRSKLRSRPRSPPWRRSPF